MIPEIVIEKLSQARSILVLTGAGISAESGIPTFRDALTGLWAQYDPEELATPQAFQKNPQLVWDWYEWRRGIIAQAQPNPGHYALAEMERKVERFMITTQNIDNLHRRAGSQNVIELHGNIFRCRCMREGTLLEMPADGSLFPPICPACGERLRPDVVWFGEALPSDALQTSIKAIGSADVLFAIGTSGLVHPAASFPLLAVQNGVFTIEINIERTPLSHMMNVVLSGKSGQVLPELYRAVWGKS